MILLDGLTQRGGDRDGQIADDPFSADAFGGKRKHIGRLVFVAKLAVEFADGRIGGEQDGDFTLEANGKLRFGEKPAQCAGGRKAEILLES